MNLAALDDFMTVIRHRGFGKAARATGRAKPTLSRRVRSLEAELGVLLIERGSGSMRLTDEGLLLYERADGIFGELKDLFETVGSGGRELAGRLRVSAPTSFSTVFLGAIAAEFTKQHPRVMIDIAADDHILDPIMNGLDAVIRMNPKPQGDMIGRCFARDGWVLVASPEVSQPAGEGSEIAAVAVAGDFEATVWKYRDGNQHRQVTVRTHLKVSSMLAMRAAVLAGAGVAILPRSIAARALATGRLALWGIPDRPPTEIWVMHNSRRLESGRLRAFTRFLENSFPGGKLPDTAE